VILSGGAAVTVVEESALFKLCHNAGRTILAEQGWESKDLN
jgi:hypothetical protein